MDNNSNNYFLLISKLDQFIRKYYLNQLLRGLIYAATLLLALFITINILEYLLFLPSLGRKILFYGYLGTTALVAFNWIVLPLVHYLRLGKIISHEQAAQIIGRHFANVEDRLLNILQLKKQSESVADKSLIQASIDQKIDTLKPVPFSSAIDLSQNRRFLKYLAAPLVVLLVILFAAPSVIKDSSARLIRNNDSFERPAPFKFVLLNEELTALQYSDFEVQLKMTGDVMPDETFIEQGGNRFKMKKGKDGNFTYKFSNLQKSMAFNFFAAGFQSKTYNLEVVAKPMVLAFDVALDYPAYTGKTDEVISNVGDLNIPEGTKVIWDFETKATSGITIQLGDSVYAAGRQGQNHFTFVQRLTKSTAYTLKVSGDEVMNADSIAYNIQVNPDQYPSISMQSFKDSVANRYIYFNGEVADDYGLNHLYFKYKLSSNKSDTYETVPITFNRGSRISSYSYYWEVSKLGIKPGEEIKYFFEVWDNDGVNGSKSSRTNTMLFELPTKRELDAITDKNNDELKDKMSEAINKAQKLQKDIKDMKDKTLDKKNLTWEDKKAVEELIKEQQALEKTISEVQEDFKENLAQQEDYKQTNPELLEKQEKLQKLFDEVMTDEMKELFEKLEELVDKMDKQELMENLEDFELTDEQLEQEMDRMMELFKQLEFEQKMTETIEELSQLAKEEQELSEETAKGEKSAEELSQKQEELQEKLADVQKNIEQMNEMQEELNQQMDFSETEQGMQEAGNQMEQSQENLEQNKNQKASENQKKAAQKMQDMAQQMQQMQQNMQMQQMDMDMDALRQLLENLMHLSFNQEKLLDAIKETNINNPEYVKQVQQQKKLLDDAEMVEDSLYALAKRLLQIESFVTQEIKEINRNLEKGIERLEQRDKYNAGVNQQLVMTGFNNLALMFSEVMEQMQQQMAQSMPGMGNCQKPGNNKKPGQGMSMSQMQKQLNDQLQKMQEGMKQGKKPGEGGQGGMSKELAKAAAQQKAIRQALQKLGEMENKDGTKSLGNLQELMDEMDKTETELVNKQLTEQMVKRQQEILTRLLDAEKAMQERETDNKRKSEVAEELVNKMPPSLEEYLKKREAEIQLYKTVPPSLKEYYKNLVETYFQNVNF